MMHTALLVSPLLALAGACTPSLHDGRAGHPAAAVATTCEKITDRPSLAPTPDCGGSLDRVSQAVRHAVPACNVYTQRLQECYARNPSAAVLAARQTAAFEPEEPAATNLFLRDTCERDLAAIEVFCP